MFIVYPEIIATFKFANLFAIVFFTMLIMLGMDSAFGGMEGLYTAIVDEYPKLKNHPIKTRLAISAVPFLTALPTVCYGGIYVVQWLDRFAISPSIIIIAFLEIIAVMWIYGAERFYENIKEMNGKLPYNNWRILWKYICPILLAVIVVSDALMFQPLTYGSYIFPNWSNYLGYLLNVLVLIPVPAYALYVKFTS